MCLLSAGSKYELRSQSLGILTVRYCILYGGEGYNWVPVTMLPIHKNLATAANMSRASFALSWKRLLLQLLWGRVFYTGIYLKQCLTLWGLVSPYVCMVWVICYQWQFLSIWQYFPQVWINNSGNWEKCPMSWHIVVMIRIPATFQISKPTALWCIMLIPAYRRFEKVNTVDC